MVDDHIFAINDVNINMIFNLTCPSSVSLFGASSCLSHSSLDNSTSVFLFAEQEDWWNMNS